MTTYAEHKIIPWKGKVFSQLSSSLQPTQDTNATMGKILFKARPIKHAYRKEIAVNTTSQGNPRISVTIDELTSPNGFLISEYASSLCKGTQNTIAEGQQNVGVCNTATQCLSTSTSSSNTCFSVQLDARRRLRSSGMIPKKFSNNRNNDPAYFTDSRQYLVSRNRTIEQNNYSFIRQGDATVEPGTGTSKTNIYSPQGLSHCPRAEISAQSNNNTFQYVWLDGSTNTVVIPDGSYDIFSFDQAFKTTLINNTHYYVNQINISKQFLLVFSYNTLLGRIELQSLASSSFPSDQFDKGGAWSTTQSVPQFVFSNNALPKALGIYAASYPANNAFTTSQIFDAPNAGTLIPPYVQLFYKPSNPQFSVNGGVSSSTRLARLKYDTITNGGFANRQAYGSAVANALAYSVMIPGYNAYTLKDRIGYPNTLIPKINLDGTLSQCTPTRFSNM